jgi:cytochrome P450
MGAMEALPAGFLLDPAFFADPHACFARLREQAPVYRVPGTGVHLVSSWALVEQALERVGDFSSNLSGLLIRGPDGRPSEFEMAGTGTAIDVIATADDPEHALHRRIVQPLLAAGRVAALEPEIRRLAARLMRPLLDAGGGDWVAAVAHPLPTLVVARVIGLPAADLDKLLRWTLHGGEMLAGTGDAARMAELGHEAALHAQYLAAHLSRALSDPAHGAGRDLLGALADAVRGGAIAGQTAVGILVTLVGAGGETTTTLTGSAVRILAERADLQALLRADPARIPAFVEEALRVESPFNGHYRVVRRACELGGVELEPGQRLLLLWSAANRDPQAFAHPDAIDLERASPRAHLAFGRGVHFCVGAPLARLEARVVLEELLARTRRFGLDARGRAPCYVPSLFMHRLAHLDLELR